MRQPVARYGTCPPLRVPLGLALAPPFIIIHNVVCRWRHEQLPGEHIHSDEAPLKHLFKRTKLLTLQDTGMQATCRYTLATVVRPKLVQRCCSNPPCLFKLPSTLPQSSRNNHVLKVLVAANMAMAERISTLGGGPAVPMNENRSIATQWAASSSAKRWSGLTSALVHFLGCQNDRPDTYVLNANRYS